MSILRQLYEELVVDPNKTSYAVNLTGGEPFLHPQITEIIRTYRKAGFDVGLSTNGLAIRQEQIGPLKEMEATLSVSLDGSSAHVHERIRGEGTFDRTVRNIRRFVEGGIRVGVNFLLCEDSFCELESTIDLAYDLGCTGFNPINLVQLGRACDSGLKRVSEVDAFRRLAEHINKRPEQNVLFEQTSLFSSFGAALLSGVTCVSCGVGTRPCVYIDSTGNLFACANTQYEEFRLGNIRTDRLADCLRFDHPVMKIFAKLEVEKLNPTCRACDVRKFCGGDCRGETYNVTRDLYAPHIACKDRRESIIELMWIVAEFPWIFKPRANEFLGNISRAV